jgi:hypothetical protein
MTWVYRIATNYLKTMRKGKLEDQYTFESFGAELDDNLSDDEFGLDSPVQKALLLEEVKIGCTTGMLLCIDRDHRLAYILGDILEIDSQEAAEILEIPAPTFRKRLSRARADIVQFMRVKCGLVDSENSCRCRKRVNYALNINRVNLNQLHFAHDPERALRFHEVVKKIRTLEFSQRVVAIYRSHPQSNVPGNFASMVKDLIHTRELHA